MRKSFAVLLIGSWIGLSGVDALEAGKPITEVDLQLSGAQSASHGDARRDLFESPDLTVSYQYTNYQPGDLLSGSGRSAADPRAGKIYKVLRVFLI
jgi:hypothetical protein